MTNYNIYMNEMKRDIFNFSEKISNGLSKPTSKFILDMIYGIEKSESVLFSNIARALDEDIKLGYTIERLCDNSNNLSKTEVSIIKNNYFDEAMK